MSYLQLDGDGLGRLLARVGVTKVDLDASGAKVVAPGWDARVERLQIEATVRVGAVSLHVTGIEFAGEGVAVRFTVG